MELSKLRFETACLNDICWHGLWLFCLYLHYQTKLTESLTFNQCSGLSHQTPFILCAGVVTRENSYDGPSYVCFNFLSVLQGQAPDTEIGRVYVYDLDDWDLPDKKFYWEGAEHPHFKLNEDSGMITMRHGTQDGWWVEIISHFINWNLWNNSLMHWTPT